MCSSYDVFFMMIFALALLMCYYTDTVRSVVSLLLLNLTRVLHLFLSAFHLSRPVWPVQKDIYTEVSLRREIHFGDIGTGDPRLKIDPSSCWGDYMFSECGGVQTISRKPILGAPRLLSRNMLLVARHVVCHQMSRLCNCSVHLAMAALQCRLRYEVRQKWMSGWNSEVGTDVFVIRSTPGEWRHRKEG